MDLGINLNFDDGETGPGIIDLMGRLGQAGIKDLRVLVGRGKGVNRLLKQAYKAAKDNGQRIYLLPEAVTHTPIQADVVAELFEQPKALFKHYDAVLDAADPAVTRGVGFVDHFYLAAQSHDWVKHGISTDVLVTIFTQVAEMIHKFGAPVVMPIRKSDMHGSVWSTRLNFDVFDVEGFHERGDTVMVGDVHAAKPVWIGTAGQVGGHLFPTHQSRWLESYRREVGDRVEVIYLHSRRGTPHFDWSHLAKRIADVQANQASEQRPDSLGDAQAKPA